MDCSGSNVARYTLATFKSAAAGLTRPLMIALLRKEYKSSRKGKFDELDITAKSVATGVLECILRFAPSAPHK